MPNCFQLIRKSNHSAGPVVLQTVDEEMCKHFGVKCNPKRWHHEWYGIIGFGLACGKSFDDFRKTYKQYVKFGNEPFDIKMLEVIDWLDANFTTDAFATVGR